MPADAGHRADLLAGRWAQGKAGALESRHNLGPGQTGDQRPDAVQNPVARTDAIIVAAQALVGPERIKAEQRAEALPKTVRHDTNEDREIARFNQVIDRPGGQADRHGGSGLPSHRHLRHVLADDINGGFEQRCLHLLPAPGAVALLDRGHDRDNAEHAAGDVDDARSGEPVI